MTNNPDRYVIQNMDADMISLSDIGWMLLREKRLIIVSTLICLSVCLLYLLMVKPVWRASALIKVDYNQSEFIIALHGVGNVKLEKPSLAAEIELLKTTDFVRASLLGLGEQKLNVNEFLNNYIVKEKVKGAGIIEISLKGNDSQEIVSQLERITNYFIQQGGEKFQATLDRVVTVVNNRVALSYSDLKEAGAVLFEAEVAVSKMPDKQGSMLLLKLENALVETRARYTDALHQQVMLKQAKDLAGSGVYVLNRPEVDVKSAYPQYKLIIMFALMLGVGLGAIAVFFQEVFRRGVRTAVELENKAQMSVLASVVDRDLEGIRELRTNLLYLLGNSTTNRVLVCSPTTAEEKCSVVVNLAKLLAKAGKKVLLIDADLRKVNEYKESVKTQIGLSDLLQSGTDIEKNYLRAIVSLQDNLDLITEHNSTDSPSELLMQPVLGQLLEVFSSHYDVVLIHSAAILDCSDSVIIGGLCDVCIMVVRAETTTTYEIKMAKRRLQLGGVNVSGCVLNGLKKGIYE
ncbi:Wzz/FepE/Etk N-terminal domain-containing protein [Endozoicomonas sp.]|uniref:Wzz/FepE/Etk N-terminal domain-containing protein n=1 Tax=Endozoicomonas sp. TaxID=1892382 RepID=UPI003AF508BC